MSKRDPNYNENGNMHLDVRNDYVYAKHPQKMSIYAMRLLRIAIAQCKMGDNEFFEYSFEIPKLAEMIGCDKHNLYRVADDATDQLLAIVLKTSKMAPNKKGKKHQVFYSCDYSEDGKVVMQLHPQMKEMLLNLKNQKKPGFTEIPIAPMLLMKSKYAVRMYELICQLIGIKNMPYANVAVSIYISVEDIRLVTETDEKKTYDHISHLKNKVLLPALADIENCAEWKIICNDKKKGKRVIGFDLEVWSRNGYEVMEKCKREGTLPPQPKYKDELDGQLSLFDDIG